MFSGARDVRAVGDSIDEFTGQFETYLLVITHVISVHNQWAIHSSDMMIQILSMMASTQLVIKMVNLERLYFVLSYYNEIIWF